VWGYTIVSFSLAIIAKVREPTRTYVAFEGRKVGRQQVGRTPQLLDIVCDVVTWFNVREFQGSSSTLQVFDGIVA
jgi:hypothetical protein